MSMNSMIADCIARVKNALHAKHKSVQVFYSTFVLNFLAVLKDEGYIESYRVIEVRKGVSLIEVGLKFYHGDPVIRSLKMVSKPGCRVYSRAARIPKVCDGLGIVVLSTPKGLMSDIQARLLGVGGEMICQIM